MTDYTSKYIDYKNSYISLMKGIQSGGHIDVDVDENTIKDEVHFWGKQLTEHALFLHFGIEDEKLKGRGLKIHLKWKDFMDNG